MGSEIVKLNFVEVTYDNLELAVRIQNCIFPLEDGRANYIEGITNDPYRKEMVNYIVFDNNEPIGVVGLYSYTFVGIYDISVSCLFLYTPCPNI